MDNNQFINNLKPVLILERSNSVLENEKNHMGTEIYLSGIFAELNIKNNNRRIYETNEYLPHVKSLQEKIKNEKLFGEIDHPCDRFVVPLAEMSHEIEHLEYEKHGDSELVMGRIRILRHTPKGILAEGLIKSGVNLSISSRASGTVNNEGKVKLNEIHTYDLVHRPGFSNAKMNLMNESLNESLSSNPYNLNNIDIIDLSKYYDNNFKPLYNPISTLVKNESKRKLFNGATFEHITSSANSNEMRGQESNIDKRLELLTEYINKNFSILEQEIETIKSNIEDEENQNNVDNITDNENNKSETEESDIYSYMEVVEDKAESIIKYQKYLADELINIKKTTDQLVSHVDYLSEKNNDTNSHLNNIAEEINENFSTLENEVNSITDHSNYISDILESCTNYLDYNKKILEFVINYNDEISEKLNQNINYTEYIAEETNRSIHYSSVILRENLNDAIAYTEKISEIITKDIKSLKDAKNKSIIIEDDNGNLNENITNEIKDNIDIIIENAKKETALLNSDQFAKHSFLKNLSIQKRNEFLSLEQETKEYLCEEISKNVFFTEKDILNIWDKSIKKWNIIKDNPIIMQKIPSDIKPIYESLNEDEKNNILKSSKSYKFPDEYSIINFWNTRPEIINASQKNNGINANYLNEAKDNTINKNNDEVKSYYHNLVLSAIK